MDGWVGGGLRTFFFVLVTVAMSRHLILLSDAAVALEVE